MFSLEQEIIDGFLVSENRKKLWRVELDMLQIFEKVCKEFNIDYFFIYGSLLGAIRHDGFIPWDDDIDIGMLREDFNKLLKIPKSVWPNYIDVQYGILQDSVSFLFRIRDKRTTGILKSEISKKNSKGIFLEIYVFDKVKPGISQKLQILFSRLAIKLLNSRFDRNPSNYKDKIAKIFAKNLETNKIWDFYTKICSCNNEKNYNYVNTISLPYYARNNEILYKLSEVRETIFHDFCDTKVRIPVDYDSCLKKTYGEYLQLPPINERGKIHEYITFYDPNNSYKKYENSNEVLRYFNGDYSINIL